MSKKDNQPMNRTDPLTFDRAKLARFVMDCELHIHGNIAPLVQMILYADAEDVEREAAKLLSGVDAALIESTEAKP